MCLNPRLMIGMDTWRIFRINSIIQAILRISSRIRPKWGRILSVIASTLRLSIAKRLRRSIYPNLIYRYCRIITENQTNLWTSLCWMHTRRRRRDHMLIFEYKLIFVWFWTSLTLIILEKIVFDWMTENKKLTDLSISMTKGVLL